MDLVMQFVKLKPFGHAESLKRIIYRKQNVLNKYKFIINNVINIMRLNILCLKFEKILKLIPYKVPMLKA